MRRPKKTECRTCALRCVLVLLLLLGTAWLLSDKATTLQTNFDLGSCQVLLNQDWAYRPRPTLPPTGSFATLEEGNKLSVDCKVKSTPPAVMMNGKLLHIKSGESLPNHKNESAIVSVLCPGQTRHFLLRPFNPPPTAIPKEDKLNVLIVLLDSVGKGLYSRMYTEVQEVLNSLQYYGKAQVYNFEGFHSLGTNSVPNKLVTWAGTCWERSCLSPILDRPENAFVSQFYKDFKDRSDHMAEEESLRLPWLFKLYSQKGYINYHAEEAAGRARKGRTYGVSSMLHFFNTIPAKGFINELFPGNILKDPGFCGHNTCPHRVYSSSGPFGACTGDRMSFTVIYDDLLNFWNVYDDIPKFAGLSMCFDHQGEPRASSCLDRGTRILLESLKEKNAFNNTVVVLMSDHGTKVGKYFTRIDGIRENTMPFLSLIFPKWFVDKYPKEHAVLLGNENRLVTHYDLHLTLRQIANYPYINEKPTDVEIPSFVYSLFDPVPITRSCEEAGIPDIFCVCHPWQPIEESEAKEAVEELNLYMNDQMKFDSRKCKKIIIDQVIRAETSVLKGKLLYNLIFSVQAKYSMIFRGVVSFEEGDKREVIHLEQHTEWYKNIKKYCGKEKIARKDLCVC